jgi:hypothetical protein
MSIDRWWNDGGGKLKYSEKNLYQYNFFTTNPTQPGLWSNCVEFVAKYADVV